ncbi:MAG: TonB-dependent receptor [Opitutaceae bacterium]|nr:TonB-dependent receptor [Opitutaceae bacterium]
MGSFAGARAGATRAADDSLYDLKRMSLEELMAIEVTSVSKRPEKLLETASAIQVITNEEIRRFGAASLPEALRLAGNLQVAQKGGHAWGISARGFNTDLANKLLVMIDGRAVYTPLYSGVFWDRQDYLLADLERIEVISGPGGTLWGANAVNGVINIISKPAADTSGLYLESGGGSPLRSFVAARYGGRLAPGIHFRVYGKYSDRDGEAYADGRDAPDTSRLGQGGFRVDAALPADNQLTVQGDAYGLDEGVLTGGTARVTGGNLLARWSRVLAEGSEVSLQAYYDRTHLELPAPPLVLNGILFAPPGVLRDDLDTYDLDFQHRFPLGRRHRVVWGLGYRFTHDVVGNSPALGFLPPTLDQELYSGFVQDEIQLDSRLRLTLGVKLEHHDYTGSEVQPGVRIQWNAAADHLVWAAVSRAVRAPSRIDRDVAQASPPYLLVLSGSPNFRSETVAVYELGWRTQLADRATLSASAFYNVYDHLRSTSLTPATILPFFFANHLEAETWGLELAASCQLTAAWRLSAAYNLLEQDVRIQPGQFDLNDARNETADPPQQVALRSSLNLPHRIEWDAALRWVDRLSTNNASTPGTVPSYFELDVRLGWQASDRVELSLVGRNLLDRQHPEYGFPSPDRVEIRRGIHGKVTWRY